MIKKLLLVWCVLLLFPGPKAWAQGQDSTPTERDIMVIAEMFPGRYDNSNQNYFDQRRNLLAADGDIQQAGPVWGHHKASANDGVDHEDIAPFLVIPADEFSISSTK